MPVDRLSRDDLINGRDTFILKERLRQRKGKRPRSSPTRQRKNCAEMHGTIRQAVKKSSRLYASCFRSKARRFVKAVPCGPVDTNYDKLQHNTLWSSVQSGPRNYAIVRSLVPRKMTFLDQHLQEDRQLNTCMQELETVANQTKPRTRVHGYNPLDSALPRFPPPHKKPYSKNIGPGEYSSDVVQRPHTSGGYISSVALPRGGAIRKHDYLGPGCYFADVQHPVFPREHTPTFPLKTSPRFAKEAQPAGITDSKQFEMDEKRWLSGGVAFSTAPMRARAIPSATSGCEMILSPDSGPMITLATAVKNSRRRYAHIFKSGVARRSPLYAKPCTSERIAPGTYNPKWGNELRVVDPHRPSSSFAAVNPRAKSRYASSKTEAKDWKKWGSGGFKTVSSFEDEQ